MKNILRKIKRLFCSHYWDERAERITCIRCNKDMSFDDPKFQKTEYRRNSFRDLKSRAKV